MKKIYFAVCTALLLTLSVLIAPQATAQVTVDKKEGAFFADFYVVQAKPMQFKVMYHHPKTDRVQVRIFDKDKNMLFGELTLVYKKYEKYFDLNTLQDGAFTFELTDGEEKFTQSFEVVTQTKRFATSHE